MQQQKMVMMILLHAGAHDLINQLQHQVRQLQQQKADAERQLLQQHRRHNSRR
jgi:hypothetical protein